MGRWKRLRPEMGKPQRTQRGIAATTPASTGQRFDKGMATKECLGFIPLSPFPSPSGRVGKVAAEIFVETARTFAIVLQVFSVEDVHPECETRIRRNPLLSVCICVHLWFRLRFLG